MRAITEVTFDCEKFQQKLSLISEIHIYYNRVFEYIVLFLDVNVIQ